MKVEKAHCAFSIVHLYISALANGIYQVVASIGSTADHSNSDTSTVCDLPMMPSSTKRSNFASRNRD